MIWTTGEEVHCCWCRRAKWTEGRNTGFKKILDALSANGSPKPEFETDDDRSYFISRLFIHAGFSKEHSESIQKNETMNSFLNSVLNRKEIEKLSPVIEYLEDHQEISSKTVMDLTGKSQPTAWRYLQILCEVNFLKPVEKKNKTIYKRCFNPDK